MRRPGLGVLQERDVRLLFTGQVVSQLGDSITPVALAFAILDFDFLVELLFSAGWTEDDPHERSWLERRTPWGRVKAWAYARHVRALMPDQERAVE